MLVSDLQNALAQTKDFALIKDIRDKAESLRAYAKQAGHSLEKQNEFAELKIRAERKAGAILKEVGLRVGNPQWLHDETIVTLKELGINKTQSHRFQQLAQLTQEEFETHIATVKTEKAELTTAGILRLTQYLKGFYSRTTTEWDSPKTIINKAVQVMGKIDLDPCSNETSPIPANQRITLEDNGLKISWHGKVYLNPPYGQKEWIEHLYTQWQSSNITEAIVLTAARTDTEWFKLLREFPRCFIKGRLKFGNNSNRAPFASVVFYLGDNIPKFIEAFNDIGDVYQLIEIPTTQPRS